MCDNWCSQIATTSIISFPLCLSDQCYIFDTYARITILQRNLVSSDYFAKLLLSMWISLYIRGLTHYPPHFHEHYVVWRGWVAPALFFLDDFLKPLDDLVHFKTSSFRLELNKMKYICAGIFYSRYRSFERLQTLCKLRRNFFTIPTYQSRKNIILWRLIPFIPANISFISKSTDI